MPNAARRWMGRGALLASLCLFCTTPTPALAGDPGSGAAQRRLGVQSDAVGDSAAIQEAGDAGRRTVLAFSAAVGSRLRPPDNADEVNYDYLYLNLPARTVLAFRAGELVGAYPAAVGAPAHPTPTGVFKITTRIEDPTWYPPDGSEPVPPGPDNPVGSRWLGIDLPGYGLHGTNAPASIGRAVSLGCVRLFPGDVETLFGRVRSGTPVEIVYDRLWVHQGGDGEALVGLFPDIYGRQSLTVEMVLEALAPAGLDDAVPTAVLASWVEAATAGPLLVELTGQGVTGILANLQPLPGAVPIMRDDDLWLPVRPLARHFAASLTWLPWSGHLLLDGRPLAGRMIDGRIHARLDDLARMLHLQWTMALSAHRPVIALHGWAVHWGAGWRSRETVLTPAGSVAVPAALLERWYRPRIQIGNPWPLSGSPALPPRRITWDGQVLDWWWADRQAYVALDDFAAAAGLRVQKQTERAVLQVTGR